MTAPDEPVLARLHRCALPGVWWRWRHHVRGGDVLTMPCGHQWKWTCNEWGCSWEPLGNWLIYE